MNSYQSLSVILTDLLGEAKLLMQLRSEFGRIPNGLLRTTVLERIDAFFAADANFGYDLNHLKPKCEDGPHVGEGPYDFQRENQSMPDTDEILF